MLNEVKTGKGRKRRRREGRRGKEGRKNSHGGIWDAELITILTFHLVFSLSKLDIHLLSNAKREEEENIY